MESNPPAYGVECESLPTYDTTIQQDLTLPTYNEANNTNRMKGCRGVYWINVLVALTVVKFIFLLGLLTFIISEECYLTILISAPWLFEIIFYLTVTLYICHKSKTKERMTVGLILQIIVSAVWAVILILTCYLEDLNASLQYLIYLYIYFGFEVVFVVVQIYLLIVGF